MTDCVLCGKPIPIGKGRFFSNGYYAHNSCADEHDKKNNGKIQESYPFI